MAKKLGTIKSISGSAEVIAVDKSGNQRVLKVGDSLYEGETVKTTSAGSKVVIATNNGKELSMIGEDTLSLDPKATAVKWCKFRRSRRDSGWRYERWSCWRWYESWRDKI